MGDSHSISMLSSHIDSIDVVSLQHFHSQRMQLKPAMNNISSSVDLMGTVIKKISTDHLGLSYPALLRWGESNIFDNSPKNINGILDVYINKIIYRL